MENPVYLSLQRILKPYQKLCYRWLNGMKISEKKMGDYGLRYIKENCDLERVVNQREILKSEYEILSLCSWNSFPKKGKMAQHTWHKRMTTKEVIEKE